MFICVKGESMKKKIIIICLIVLVGILIIFFVKNNYKKNKIVNNISNSTLEECEKYIYDINSYEAIVQITVKSNKNENKYLIIRDNRLDNIFKRFFKEVWESERYNISKFKEEAIIRISDLLNYINILKSTVEK